MSSLQTQAVLIYMTKDVLAAALDSGLAISILVIFFALQFPKNGTVSVASPINNNLALQF
jgi:hypothetical protein